LDFGGAFPHDDRLRAFGRAERVHEADKWGLAGLATEESMQVVAQRASGAELGAVVAGFDTTSPAVEVVWDAGTGSTDGRAGWIGGAGE